MCRNYSSEALHVQDRVFPVLKNANKGYDYKIKTPCRGKTFPNLYFSISVKGLRTSPNNVSTV